MKRLIRSIAAAMLLTASAWPVQADMLSLNDISKYFNDLSTAEATFRQFNEDGSVSTGTLYIKRPGRMRFEYNPPESAVVVAGARTVVIYDTKSNQPPETYPLSRTPLNVILARTVNLTRTDMVVGHTTDGENTIVVAQDPENPEYGSIELAFSPDPVELVGWVVNDSNGGRTQVVLEQMTRGGQLSNRLFDTGRSRPSVNR